MRCVEIIKELKKYANPRNVEGMARFGIRGKNILGGPSLPELRKMARLIGKNQQIAEELWKSGIHEARVLASMVGVPGEVTNEMMEAWVADFDSWDVCDQVCSNLFDKTKYAWLKAKIWSQRREEYIKRAGFVLIATLAVHDKKAADATFSGFFPLIEKESLDERNYVKKAVNWALRQIGKRNLNLNRSAIKVAKNVQKIDSKSARWIAADALRELQSENVQTRLKSKLK